MIQILVNVSRFTLILFFAIYTFDCFAAFRNRISEERQEYLYHKQTILMYLFLINANAVLLFCSQDTRVIALLACEIIYFIVTMIVFKNFYPNSSKSLVNNMCMLLSISFVILTRLDMDKAIRQFVLAVAALVISCLIPLFIQKVKFWDKLKYFYAVVGILGLAVVCVAGSTSYGAKLNISIGSFSLQPSEFIKILFVFYIASMLFEATDQKTLLITSGVALLHVLILVASRDLGSAGIFFITYLCMIYVATRRFLYLLGGIACMFLGLVSAYFVMSHVHTRVIAWLNPLAYADNEGYQVTQSLFAIGTGGWFGSGLYQGMPTKIPVVTKDFVFSAISEELGGVFALCLILVCISCFLMFLNIAMQIRDPFYKLIALGLGVVYGIQVFLTLGGVTKFIPSTGVTLPLVSYGGSSLISTMILFAIIQGLYVRKSEEVTKNETKKRRRVR
ncbi:MAG: FtsW/RodA/SpoVE family cell cycle protein [Lachnospiraceae bacterium]|nr:FtsW/RodA/SpoVE family cell cycle protein [Lachnospiraceae bacterium]